MHDVKEMKEIITGEVNTPNFDQENIEDLTPSSKEEAIQSHRYKCSITRKSVLQYISSQNNTSLSVKSEAQADNAIITSKMDKSNP